MLKLCALLFAVSSIGAAVPTNLPEFAAARLTGGLAIGVASLLAPIYIAEISPARIRGRLVALNQMAIMSGILLAYLVNWGLSFQGGESWRWMFAVAVAPSLFFLVGLFFVPESPRWLIENDRDEEALKVLCRVMPIEEAEREAASIHDGRGAGKRDPRASSSSLACGPHWDWGWPWRSSSNGRGSTRCSSTAR